MKRILSTITNRRSKQRGDTIVEVVLALTVLGLVLGTSSVLANRNTKTLQTSQENTYALRVAQAQLEYVRTYVTENPDAIPNATTTFCMKSAAEQVTASSADCKKTNGGAEYRVYITSTPIDGGYSVKATAEWDTLTGTPGNVELSYKVYRKSSAMEARGTDACPAGQSYDYDASPPGCQPIPPQIRAKVQVIPPVNGKTTPACGSAANKEIGGAKVTLSSLSGAPNPRIETTKSTDGVAIFDNLNPNTSYGVSLTVPTGYQECSPISADVRTQQGSNDLINFKIRPVCTDSLVITEGSRVAVMKDVWSDVGYDYYNPRARSVPWFPANSGRHPTYNGKLAFFGNWNPVGEPSAPTAATQYQIPSQGRDGVSLFGNQRDPLSSGQFVWYEIVGTGNARRYEAFKYGPWIPSRYVRVNNPVVDYYQRTDTYTTTHTCPGFPSQTTITHKVVKPV